MTDRRRAKDKEEVNWMHNNKWVLVNYPISVSLAPKPPTILSFWRATIAAWSIAGTTRASARILVYPVLAPSSAPAKRSSLQLALCVFLLSNCILVVRSTIFKIVFLYPKIILSVYSISIFLSTITCSFTASFVVHCSSSIHIHPLRILSPVHGHHE